MGGEGVVGGKCVVVGFIVRCGLVGLLVVLVGRLFGGDDY